jgi:hypothetical protein
LGDGANPLQTAQLKLSMCQQGLSGWSIAKYGSVDKDIQSKNQKLAALHMVEGHENQEQIHQLRGEIDHLLEMEGLKWKQRAKRNWFKHRHRNTQFFRAWANSTVRKSIISRKFSMKVEHYGKSRKI